MEEIGQADFTFYFDGADSKSEVCGTRLVQLL